jgi:hypothetical protein
MDGSLQAHRGTKSRKPAGTCSVRQNLWLVKAYLL